MPGAIADECMDARGRAMPGAIAETDAALFSRIVLITTARQR